MSSSLPKLSQAGLPEALSVLLDGRVVGFMSSSVIEKAVSHLRRLKVSAVSGVSGCFLRPISCFLCSVILFLDVTKFCISDSR